MDASQSVEPEVLLSITRVARLMNLPIESVLRAIRDKQLHAEAVLIHGRLGVVVPISAVVEHWDLPTTRTHEIELEARHCHIDSPVPIITRLVTTPTEMSGTIPPPVSEHCATR